MPLFSKVIGSYRSAYGITLPAGYTLGVPQLTLPIPAPGKYLIHAKVFVANTKTVPNARVDCKLTAVGTTPGDIDNSGATLDPAAGSYETITLHTAWYFPSPPFSVDLYCGTAFNTQAEAANIKMSAIRIDKLAHGMLP